MAAGVRSSALIWAHMACGLTEKTLVGHQHEEQRQHVEAGRLDLGRKGAAATSAAAAAHQRLPDC